MGFGIQLCPIIGTQTSPHNWIPRPLRPLKSRGLEATAAVGEIGQA